MNESAILYRKLDVKRDIFSVSEQEHLVMDQITLMLRNKSIEPYPEDIE
ncbi:hypothetical protein SAMN06295888_11082 [Desulfonatronum zhilinae]|nr:hypothetical protein SAMN06295888_11082 [Desulfonatronum zhilinae]